MKLPWLQTVLSYVKTDEAADTGGSVIREVPQGDETGGVLLGTNQVVPWVELVSLAEPDYPKGANGRPPVGIECMLYIHFLQHCSICLTLRYRDGVRLEGDARVCEDKPGTRSGAGPG